jgi:hypothetical protein
MILAVPSEVSVSSRQFAYVQKRRSTRVYNTIPIAIQGSDAFHAPYLEQVSTLTVNCHGCRYRSNNEVIQGDTVYLEVKQSSERSATYSCQAKVKWVQRLLTKDPCFEIAVELAAPGNIWGILSPPDDWIPSQMPKAIERETSRREQPLATRIEQPMIPILNEESAQFSPLDRRDPPTALPPSLGPLMAGFGKQIPIVDSHTITAAFVKERDRLMGEFRMQLQDEATRTLEFVISTSKEELTRRVLNELNDTHEAAARLIYERWNKKIELDSKNAAQSLMTQGMEVSRRVEGMTVSTIERLQRNMEASRTEAVDRFLSRLREQLAPMLEDARITLENLTASENKLRDECQAIHGRFDDFLQEATQNSIAEVREKTLGMLAQFESDVTKRLVESDDGMHETSVEVIAETTKIVRELSKGCEETVQGQLRSLVLSAVNDVTKILKERTSQISCQFSNQLEGNTRSYLELIGESIAQIPKKMSIQSGEKS